MSLLEDQVNALYADSAVQRMLALSATAEPLRICYPKEVNVSRFIAWLLDPSEGHGLGDMAIRSLLTRAGQTERALSLSVNDRRYLSAANIHTQAFSAMLLATEIDVGDKAMRRLDVLAVDPAAGLYIAVENKFGAKERAVMKEYREGLMKLFPGYRGVHIFLDSSEAEPDDDAWLPVGYDWLVDFLRDCEQRDSVASHVKSTLRQFRAVIEDDESAASTPMGTLITHVASKYGASLDAMRSLVKPQSKSARARDLARLVEGGLISSDAKASVRLFQLYCRRPNVWDQCFRQTLFAPFYKALREKFADLQPDPRRVVTTFALAGWDRFLDTEGKDEWYWCAGVRVRHADEQFNVVSYMHLVDVKAEKRDALLALANQIRVANGIRPGREDNGWLAIRRVRGLSATKAVEAALEQMSVLKDELAKVR